MPHIVSGALKEYDWGVVDGLARWIGPTGAPQAELWFGTHPSGPTIVVDGPDAGASLADIDAHRGMPLVKILAAGKPLSIQVHPDAALAQRGWASGSPLFADDAEKAEVLMALEPFDIHAGWRDAQEAADVLADAGAFDEVVQLVRAGDPVASTRRLVALEDAERALIVGRLADAARRQGWPDGAVASLERVIAAFPGDPGVLVTVLVDHDVLRPGEAIAVSAGVVHSYVAGLGVEVMTTSDNVLRLGLTNKAIAVDEALEAVSRSRAPQRLHAPADQPFRPDGMPFDVLLTSSSRTLATGQHRLVLALEGQARIDSAAGAGDIVATGRAAVWHPDEPDATVVPQGTVVFVTGARQLPG